MLIYFHRIHNWEVINVLSKCLSLLHFVCFIVCKVLVLNWTNLINITPERSIYRLLTTADVLCLFVSSAVNPCRNLATIKVPNIYTEIMLVLLQTNCSKSGEKSLPNRLILHSGNFTTYYVSHQMCHPPAYARACVVHHGRTSQGTEGILVRAP